MRKIVVIAALLLCFHAFAEEAETPMPAGYVRVTAAAQVGWLPLPTEGERVVPLRQVFADGTEYLNVVHLTPDSVYMEDANCKNHDCVDEGVVTFENIPERILSNMIVCLPNQVLLELFTPEETMEMLGELPVLPADE